MRNDAKVQKDTDYYAKSQQDNANDAKVEKDNANDVIEEGQFAMSRKLALCRMAKQGSTTWAAHFVRF